MKLGGRYRCANGDAHWRYGPSPLARPGRRWWFGQERSVAAERTSVRSRRVPRKIPALPAH